ncbi:hypothetical protein FACS1894202_02430 [Clostridia bacterium]|nr:hypothetical protein FACS1894202_02430 [Clostridia bacterium]
MFSRLEVSVGGVEIDLHNAKASELLAFLACERGAVSKAKAADRLWPDAEPKRAMDSLYHILRHIRQLENGAEFIEEQRGAVSLGRRVGTDADEFVKLYNSDNPEDWRKAVELYRNVLLIDSVYDWAIDYESHYDTIYYDVLSRLSAHYESCGNRVLARYYKDKLNE